MISRKVKQNETNVAVAKKEQPFLSIEKQIAIMHEYTETHKKYKHNKLKCEIECLKIIFPNTFRPMYTNDILVGRTDILNVGFGSVTSLGGVSHYGRTSDLKKMLSEVNFEDKKILNNLIKYWESNDTRNIFYKEFVIDKVVGPFVDVLSPAIITARLSGMNLDYNLLLDNGISGLKKLINLKKEINVDSSKEYEAMIEALELLQQCISQYKKIVICEMENEKDQKRIDKLQRLVKTLEIIYDEKPTNFIEAVQLSWLYSNIAGVVNYGRMDDYLGDYLVKDLNEGVLTYEEAFEITCNLWELIEVKRTNVNGRVIVGGKGRRNPKAADVFCKLAIKVTKKMRFTEPQFTLRIYNGMDQDIYDLAIDSIATGITYPIIYNDDVNIKNVMQAMNVEREIAEQYVPFGCGEFVLSGMGVGTPNSCINVLKVLDIYLHNGVDQWDQMNKNLNNVLDFPISQNSFDEFFDGYKILLSEFIDYTAKAHFQSYKFMNDTCGFIFASILTSDCIGRGKMVLDGGAFHLGGTNEMYGNINASDSLTAIKKLVFDGKKYTLEQIRKNLSRDFDIDQKMQNDMINVEKFGNDYKYPDDIAVELHEYICKQVIQSGKKYGFDSWLVVIINNQVNTEWGRATASTADGRIAGMYMANAVNPQSGMDNEGPSAVLDSILKLRTDLHGGSVQNIKFDQKIFTSEITKIKFLLENYFEKGGNQIMINVVNQKDLIDAVSHPEKHADLIVRVGGFSAKFVNLEPDVQSEIIARTCNA